MATHVVDVIGVMDPNRYALKATLEAMMTFMDLNVKWGGQTHRVVTARVPCRPYNTLGPLAKGQGIPEMHAVLNRGAHWNPHQNSLLTLLSPHCYLLNDMSSFFAVDKNAAYGQMARLGLRIPPTVAIPQQDYSELKGDPKVHQDLMFEDFQTFDLEGLGELVGFPAFLKPQSGGGWVGVERVANQAELEAAYARSGDRPMNLQREVPYREFVRAIGIGPTILPMHYNPLAPYSHDRYLRSPTKAVDHHFLNQDEEREVVMLTRIIDAFYSWDHNSCEALIDPRGLIWPIDFANAYPDSSPISLHYYFPEVVKAMARWLIFNAVVRRQKAAFGAGWGDYFRVADQATQEGVSYVERLGMFHSLALQQFDAERFWAFCDECLADFDQQAYDFFGSDVYTAILEKEIAYYFRIPSEWEGRMEHYMGIHNFWMHCESQRMRGITRSRSMRS